MNRLLMIFMIYSVYLDGEINMKELKLLFGLNKLINLRKIHNKNGGLLHLEIC